MPPRGSDRNRTVLIVALAVGLALRLARLARDPLLHPDGPAYLGLATDLLEGRFLPVLGGYYSPLYPALVALVAALGIPLELAGRLAAIAAGLAALPLLHALVRRALDERSAAAAVLVAALHPALVKASVHVLPETLAGALLLGWLLALPGAPLTAGALAGAAYLARPEGIMLLPLGLWRLRRRVTSAVPYAAVVLALILPALVALRVQSGHWQLTARDARVAAGTGVPGATSLLDAARRDPAVFLRYAVLGVGEQALDDAKALGPLLWLPFGVGLAAAAVRATSAWPLAVAAWFTAVPLALNPSPRYAVPLVALLLPPVGAGLIALGARFGRRAPVAAGALAVALAVQGVWVSNPFDAACSREVSGLVLERYGPGQALVAVDGRFAYGARGRALVPASTDPNAALALARRKGAHLWLTRPAWIRPPWTAPSDVRPVARPCGGTFVLFEIGG